MTNQRTRPSRRGTRSRKGPRDIVARKTPVIDRSTAKDAVRNDDCTTVRQRRLAYGLGRSKGAPAFR